MTRAQHRACCGDIAKAVLATWLYGSLPAIIETGLRGTLAMWVRVVVAIALLFLPTTVFAQAEKRIALLIGNQAYGNEIGRLTNPRNDVALLEKTLKDLGFEVTTVRDVGLASLTTAVNAYTRRVKAAGPNAVGFFYYSGHGAADAGTNYLIPVDVKTTETGELWDQSLRLTEIMRKLKTEAGNATHFVVFDACRNTLKLTRAGSRSLVQSKGFVPVAQESGMLIAYATAEGELASDVGAGAGPYATVLAEEIVRPGFEAVTMFRNVQRRVRMAINQEPYLGFNAMGDVYLAGAPNAQAPARLSEAAEAWDRAKDTTSISALEALIRRFGDTYYGDLAKVRLAGLRESAAAKKKGELREKVLSLAEKHRLLVPEFEIEVPAPDVPAPLRRFVGIWVDENGFARKGRDHLLIVTGVEKEGSASGYFVFGPPRAGSFHQGPASYHTIVGRIERDTLSFSCCGGADTFKFTLISRKMHHDYSNTRGQSTSFVLDSVWSLVESERATAR